MNQSDKADKADALPRRGFLGGVLATGAAAVLTPAQAAEPSAAVAPGKPAAGPDFKSIPLLN